jgi:hypothetical protein
VSGVTVEAFWDSRSAFRRGLKLANPQKSLKIYQFPCMEWVSKRFRTPFQKVIFDVPLTYWD